MGPVAAAVMQRELPMVNAAKAERRLQQELEIAPSPDSPINHSVRHVIGPAHVING